MDTNGYLVLLTRGLEGVKRGGLATKLPEGATECVPGEGVFQVGDKLYVKLRGLSEKLYDPEPLNVRATKVDVENSDDRSYGCFELVLETPRGKLACKGSVYRGDVEECHWTLNGGDLPGCLEGPEVEFPPLGEGATLTLRDRVFVRGLEETVAEWYSEVEDWD